MSTLLAIVGPTAAGKSEVALRIARRVGASILSVDSMQVYRGMDVGTAKPTAAERALVPHHMIDLVEPEEEYTVAEFQRTARETIEQAAGPVLIVGGSGLHFRAVVDPLTFAPHDPDLRASLETADAADLRAELVTADPAAGDHVDLDNPRRVVRAVEVLRLTGETPSIRADTPEAVAVAAYRPLLPFRAVGIDPGDALGDRVPARFEGMLRRGLLDEVRALAPRLGRTASQAVGYKELLGVVDGTAGLDDASADAVSATLALARRQRTWFGRDPRIRWVEWTEDPDVLVERVLDSFEREAASREAAWTS